jgi:Concanavalin A-like lectin/glucanases superfamily
MPALRWHPLLGAMLLAPLLAACEAPNPLYVLRDIDAPAADGPPRPPDAGDGWVDGPAAPDASTDPPIDLRANLLGHWKLDETSGTTAADSSGNGHTGQLEGTPVPTWSSGQIGGALLMPADASQHSTGVKVNATLPIRTLQRFTIAAWTLRTDLDTNRIMTVMSRQVGTGNNEVFNVGMDGAILRGWIQDPTSGSIIKVNGPALSQPLGSWIHLAMTYDGNEVVLYTQGVRVASVPYSGGLIADETNPLYIGTNKNFGTGTNYHGYWEGKLDDVLLYSVAHSADTIRMLSMGAGPGP